MTSYVQIEKKLDTIIAKLSSVEQCQAVERERVEALFRLVEKHERILFGDDGEGGLIQEVNAMVRAQANAIKAMWMVLGPVLTAIGGGIVYIIAQIIP